MVESFLFIVKNNEKKAILKQNNILNRGQIWIRLRYLYRVTMKKKLLKK